ncbi:unnamed protein product [Didymodactylos carnosus]|uniref:Pentapeptide repeat-containing protein n=1 Tax=Didymodactylos carnosus TaxID=1234261 RepID=A0A814YH85_9BILA|nr:unnamed protein product [Didymodactylos carnosus]CAF1228725.1 unnamed protein product [Didymodactylos carnosus]CAF3807569.1 unnamed protein product [Didymodactylos carnosus]CAF3991482.1 unnamed protein product [Didymodactylos carnosus]
MYRKRLIRQPAIRSVSNSPPSDTAPAAANKKKKLNSEQRCLSWFNLILSALIPLMIGIFTVVSYIQQQQIAYENRKQDRKIEDRRRSEDQHRAENLHYENVYEKYIEDISNSIFKHSTNQTSFLDNQTRFAYIKSKTLTALRRLDWERKTYLFLFLLENGLLPGTSLLDLSGANFVNITVKSSISNKYQFNNLSLTSVDLTNSSFIACNFVYGGNLADSALSGIDFSSSFFMDTRKLYFIFDSVVLERANFQDAILHNIRFINTELSYSNFNNTVSSQVYFISVNLIDADFSGAVVLDINTCIVNSNLTGMKFANEILMQLNEYGNLLNVLLPNQTWLIDERNLVRNGDAETNCASEFDTDTGSNRTEVDRETISNWNVFKWGETNSSMIISLYNKTDLLLLGNCYFNLADEVAVKMIQFIDLSNYSLIIDNGSAEYSLSLLVNMKQNHCLQEYFMVSITHQVAKQSPNFIIHYHYILNYFNHTEWIQCTLSGPIPWKMRLVKVEIGYLANGTCLVDNIEFHIRNVKNES